MKLIEEFKNKSNHQEYNKFLEEKIEYLMTEHFIPEKQSKNIQYLNNKIKELTKEINEKQGIEFSNDYLIKDVIMLSQIVQAQNSYIDYLLNSYWWKITGPFRVVSRRLKGFFRTRTIKKDNIVFNIDEKNLPEPLKIKVSVMIYSYNFGDEFIKQLKELKGQYLINEIELVVVDYGSTDNTIELAKWYNAKIIHANQTTESIESIYKSHVDELTGDYVVIMNENKTLDDYYWLYKAIKPIYDENTIMTCFYSEKTEIFSKQKYSLEYYERINKISGEKVLFLPKNRDTIQYVNPGLLRNFSIIVKRKNSNIFYN